MPKKKRPPRPGQFGAPALAGLAKRRKAEVLQNAGAAQLRVLQQDKGPAGNSIAETARSVGQAALETARRAAAKHAAEQEWDQEQDRQVRWLLQANRHFQCEAGVRPHQSHGTVSHLLDWRKVAHASPEVRRQQQWL
tara:strand:+ start:235 stop:645 length:411 start_codon:yes stop_codon:yes gene_type:complete